jgi:acetolactate synthase-1/2/3 large subunit
MLVKEFISQFLNKNKCSLVFGMSGANIEDLFNEIQKSKIKIVLAKNEYNATMMAVGHYHKMKKPTFVLTTSGAGVLNTIPAVAEAYSSEVPLFLIAGQTHTFLEGSGGFQDTSGKNGSLDISVLLGACTAKTIKLEKPDDISKVMHELFLCCLVEQKPVALLIPKDFFNAEIFNLNCQFIESNKPLLASTETKESLAKFVDKAKGILLVLGEELETEQQKNKILNFADKIKAKIAVVPVLKGFIDHNNRLFAGITGVMGHESVDQYIEEVDSVIFLGAKFDFLSSFGHQEQLQNKHILAINSRQTFTHLLKSKSYQLINESVGSILENFDIQQLIEPQFVDTIPLTDKFNFNNIINCFNNHLKASDDVFVDAGNSGAFVVNALKSYGRSVFYISLGMGGMGNSIGAGIGSCLSSDNRTYIFLGDGSFLIQGLEIHTAVENNLPITFIIFNNNSHGMCNTREKLYFNQSSGLNDFRKSYFGLGISKMFPGVFASEINTVDELKNALFEIENHNGVSLLSINVSNDEQPPFKSFKQSK